MNIPVLTIKKLIIVTSLFLILFLIGCTQINDTNIDLENCKTYFDGCNTCSVIDGEITGCTEKACESVDGGSAYKEPECLEYY